MSYLQDDQDVIKDGRRNKLTDAEVPLRDRIVQRLKDKLNEEEIATKLQQDWSMASAEMTERLMRQQEFLDNLDNFDLKDMSDSATSFGGQSSLHLPVAFIQCKTYQARFLEAILGIDPPFSLKARREDGTDRLPVVEDLLRYTLNSWANTNRGWGTTVDPWIWNWCTTGTGIMRIRWKTTWERYLDVVDKPKQLPPIVDIDSEGNQTMIPQWTTEEVEEEKTVKTFDGPQYDLCEMEDFRMIGGAGDPDLADKVLYRTYMSASELWTKVDQGIFDEEVVKEIIRGGSDSEYAGDNNSLKMQRKSNAGDTVLDSEVNEDRYEVVESCFGYDVDGSGINSQLVTWHSPRSDRLLGCTYLRRIMPSGERPYAVIHFHKRPGESFGLGLLEILNPLTRELDAMHNIRMDNALFQSIPFFFYRASSSMDAENFQVQPGMGIPLDNPQTDVFFPNVGNRTSFTAQEEQVLQSFIERLTGISDLSLGVMSGTQGATRTASGVRAVLGENNNNLSVHLRRLNIGVDKVLRTTYHMLQNRVEPGFAFRVTGDTGQDVFRKVWDTDLALDVDFELSSNTSNSNKSVQVEVNQQLVAITQNPLNIQMGLSSPAEMYAAQKQYLNSLGVKDVHRFLRKPEGYTYIMSPQEEFNRVIRNEPVQILPQMDHAGFIAFTQSMLNSQQEVRTLNPEQEGLAIEQMRAHMDMQAALQQQQAQQANVQQQQMNAQQSQMQAPAALNPQAGADPSQLFL